MNTRNTIMSFERGLQVLETLSLSFRPLTLTEVAGRMDLNLAATQRFLNTLCATGYAVRDANKAYSLSTKVLTLGFNFLGGSTLSRLARPVLDAIHAELHETTNLTVLDGFEVIHLDRREGYSVLKYSLGPGSRLPAHCTSTGKMLLAGLTDEELLSRLVHARLPAVTPRTITSKEELMRDIKGIRARGYSICDRELSMDLYSMAVPLLGERSETVAAVAVTIGCQDVETKKEKVIERLMRAGADLSKLLGYRGPYPARPVRPDPAQRRFG